MFQTIGTFLGNIILSIVTPFKSQFITADMAANGWLDGDPKQTISARCGFDHAKGSKCWWTHVLYQLLDWLMPGHCEKAAGLPYP